MDGRNSGRSLGLPSDQVEGGFPACRALTVPRIDHPRRPNDRSPMPDKGSAIRLSRRCHKGHGQPAPLHRPHAGNGAIRLCATPRQTRPHSKPRAQLAFKDWMTHGILQFTLSIAFRYVLHRGEGRDIRCRESCISANMPHGPPQNTGSRVRAATRVLGAPGTLCFWFVGPPWLQRRPPRNRTTLPPPREDAARTSTRSHGGGRAVRNRCGDKTAPEKGPVTQHDRTVHATPPAPQAHSCDGGPLQATEGGLTLSTNLLGQMATANAAHHPACGSRATIYISSSAAEARRATGRVRRPNIPSSRENGTVIPAPLPNLDCTQRGRAV